MSEQHVESEYERGYAVGFQSGRDSRAGEVVYLHRRVRKLIAILEEVLAGKSPWEIVRKALRAADEQAAQSSPREPS